MTIEQALKIINRKMTDIEKWAENERSEKGLIRFDNEYSMLCLCKTALEKQIPKARFQTRCGVCELWLNECDWGDEDWVLSEAGQFNYCPRCGQRIDWTRDDCYDKRSEDTDEVQK